MPRLKKEQTRYHSGEQQSHEQGPCDQEEDDEDADDFIQRSLQPHDHLRTHREEEEIEERGGGGLTESRCKVSAISEEVGNIQWSDTWRNLCPPDVKKPFWI